MAKKKMHFSNVRFQGVSIGKGCASLSVSVPIEPEANLNEFREVLLRSRLKVTMEVTADESQPELIKGTHPSISSIADTGKLSVDTDGLGVRLVFKRSEVDLTVLADFSSQSGKISCEKIGSSVQEPVEDDEPEPE